MELRYHAVIEVLAGVPVTEVAQQFGVSRQAVHKWRRPRRHVGRGPTIGRGHGSHASAFHLGRPPCHLAIRKMLCVLYWFQLRIARRASP